MWGQKIDLIIREMRWLDIPKIVKMHRQSSDKLKRLYNPLNIQNSFFFIAFYVLKNRKTVVAFDGKKLIGYAEIGASRTGINPKKWTSIMIKEGYHGQGIGKKLMELLLEGQNNVYLCVYNDNIKAKRLYESLGFKEINEAITMCRK